jgi:hypothetical protein
VSFRIRQSVLKKVASSACRSGKSITLRKAAKRTDSQYKLRMKISLKWLTPVLLRLLSLSHVSLANGVAAALQNAGSVHLVVGLNVGLAAHPQPHDLSLDSTTYLQLTNQEFALPIMPL